MTDPTRKTRTKNVQKNRSRSPRDQQRLLESVLDHQQSSVVLVDSDRTVSYLNSAAETLLTASSHQALGQPLDQIFTDPALSDESWDQVQNQENPVTKRAARVLRRDGSAINADYSLIPVPGLGGVLLELTEINRLVRIGRDDQFVTAQETSKQLVRGLAHEVKNPLGGIRGAAQLLQIKIEKMGGLELAKGLTKAKDQMGIQNEHIAATDISGLSESGKSLESLVSGFADYTKVIIDEADRLTSLVDRMLGPNQPLQFEPTNIHEVLARVQTLVVAEAQAKLKIRRDFDPSLPPVPADPEQLVQALLNILRNAMQALEHTTDPTISLRTRVERNFTIGTERHRMVLCLDVSDNGPGIPDDLVDRIFFPMITSRVEGTGLGLAITQNIIGQHNGLLEVDSRPGNTRFSVYLPVTQS